MHNTVHFILQGKGGIGKTLVSTILAQWLAGKGSDTLCAAMTPTRKTPPSPVIKPWPSSMCR